MYLGSIGIEVELAEKPLGAKLRGQYIDEIRVSSIRRETWKGLSQPCWEAYDFIVRGDVSGLGKTLKASLRISRRWWYAVPLLDMFLLIRDRLQGQVPEIMWTGGQLAELLNSDTQLTSVLAGEKQLNIKIKPNRKRQWVEIRGIIATGDNRDTVSLSNSCLEAFNQVARHIRSYLPPPGVS
ncbi:hypothetical protein ACFLXE_07020 [Chloroflexota bacterium]